jgi:DNA-binding transcriptional MerR regulator
MTSDKAPDAFRTISEAAEDLGLEQHVLRFWETRFSQIKPLKRGGGRRYYRPDDIDFLRGLKHLLHDQRYTIKGVQKIIKEQGAKSVVAAGRTGFVAAPGETAQARLPQARPQPQRAHRPIEMLASRQASQAPAAALKPVSLSPDAGMREMLEAALADLMAAKQLLASV